MGINKDIADHFKRMAQVLEVLGENRFRVNAHAKAARVLESLTDPADTLGDDDTSRKKALTELDGIGAATADKINEFVNTGKMSEHDELLEKVPPGLPPLLSLEGLGPKTVALLWKEKNVENLNDLKKIIDDGSILDLPRMGKKTVENLKDSIEFAREAGRRLSIGLVMPLAETLAERMAAVPGVSQAQFAGSLRRGKETIGDIDILVATTKPAEARDAFLGMDEVRKVLAKGDSKCSARFALGQNFGRWRGLEEDGEPTIQVDLRMVEAGAWGAALMYFTGSKDHNVKLRERALKNDLTLNEYGLFPEDRSKEEEDTPPQSRGVKPVAAKTEDAIYKKLDLPEVPPEMREDRGELDTDIPDLVTVDSIKSELHAHTTESDGNLPLAELVANAKQRGCHTIAVTDHSQSSAVAGGLDPKRLKKQRKDIEKLRDTDPGIEVLCGSEVDILADGSLDYTDEVLAQLDWFVASPHASLKQDTKTATARLLKAIEHPLTRVIGHPTGRLINRRPGLDLAWNELLPACKENDVALEVNAHWMRLDLRDTHVKAAVDAGVLIAIHCDVHIADDFDNLRYGVLTARRGWLPKERCINCWTKAKLLKWIER